MSPHKERRGRPCRLDTLPCRDDRELDIHVFAWLRNALMIDLSTDSTFRLPRAVVAQLLTTGDRRGLTAHRPIRWNTALGVSGNVLLDLCNIGHRPISNKRQKFTISQKLFRRYDRDYLGDSLFPGKHVGSVRVPLEERVQVLNPGDDAVLRMILLRHV